MSPTLIMLAILVPCAIYAFIWMRQNMCFIHWKIKDYPSLYPSKKKFCSICVLETVDPQIRCSCGFKGRRADFEIDADDLFTGMGFKVRYYCPNCNTVANEE